MMAREKHFELSFPHAFVLDYEKYYNDPAYNNIRRCKMMLFSQCIGELDFSPADRMRHDIDKYRKYLTDAILENLAVQKSTIKRINTYLYSTPFNMEYIVTKLEKGCLNRAIEKSRTYDIRCVWSEPKFVDLYHNICYKLSSNLDSNSCVKSDYIRKKIIGNTVDLSNVANLSSKDLCPKKYEKIDQKIDKRNNLERKIKFSEMYKCSKCKRNQCTTERRYARAIDEGVDLTIHCVFCGHSWCA
jgi:DNA-directed RNA polymerase subunit M/transcription elongation factor TFIIS